MLHLDFGKKYKRLKFRCVQAKPRLVKVRPSHYCQVGLLPVPLWSHFCHWALTNLICKPPPPPHKDKNGLRQNKKEQLVTDFFGGSEKEFKLNKDLNKSTA